jgi:hypothetical protein
VKRVWLWDREEYGQKVRVRVPLPEGIYIAQAGLKTVTWRHAWLHFLKKNTVTWELMFYESVPTPGELHYALSWPRSEADNPERLVELAVARILKGRLDLSGTQRWFTADLLYRADFHPYYVVTRSKEMT